MMWLEPEQGWLEYRSDDTPSEKRAHYTDRMTSRWGACMPWNLLGLLAGGVNVQQSWCVGVWVGGFCQGLPTLQAP